MGQQQTWVGVLGLDVDRHRQVFPLELGHLICLMAIRSGTEEEPAWRTGAEQEVEKPRW